MIPTLVVFGLKLQDFRTLIFLTALVYLATVKCKTMLKFKSVAFFKETRLWLSLMVTNKNESIIQNEPYLTVMQKERKSEVDLKK